MGTVKAAGTITGNIDDFSVNGTATGDHVIARGNSIRAFDAYVHVGQRADPDGEALRGTRGRCGERDRIRRRHREPSRDIRDDRRARRTCGIGQGNSRQLSALGDYALNTGSQGAAPRVAALPVRHRLWTAPHPTAVRWGGPGVQVDSFELRNRGDRRIYANGLLPTEGAADFRLDVDNFPVGDIVDLARRRTSI